MFYIVCDEDAVVGLRDYSDNHVSELAVFDARLYIRVRRIDEPA
jgi:hypothetical protein